MKEKLTIKNFGPIKSVDLDLGKITVLIGKQATGKSTVAKVLSICRYFSYIVDDSSLIGKNFESSFVRNALRDWGLNGFEEKNTYLKYSNEDYLLEINTLKESIYDNDFIIEANIKEEGRYYYYYELNLEPKSERFKKLIEDFNKLKPKKTKGLGIYPDWNIPHSFLTTDVKKVMNNPFFFPTERGLQSIFSIGKRGLENLNDRLYEQLAALNVLGTNFKKETKIEPLNIHYKYENGQGKFKGKNDNAYFNLMQGASGYQSTIPIVLAVKYYNEIENRKRTFIVEEPEQNLFPKTQKKLIEFIAESVNKFDNQFILPTHSPYILTSLSNLMYAYQIGKSNDKVKQLIDEKYWINPDDVSAYKLIYDEKERGIISKPILDEELQEINVNDLDEVSVDNSKVWHSILNVEKNG